LVQRNIKDVAGIVQKRYDLVMKFQQRMQENAARNWPHKFAIRNFLTPLFSEWTAEEHASGNQFEVLTKPVDGLLEQRRKDAVGYTAQKTRR
jgi:hypothetical protein